MQLNEQAEDKTSIHTFIYSYIYINTCQFSFTFMWGHMHSQFMIAMHQKIIAHCVYNGISGPLGAERFPPHDSIKQILDQRMSLL